MKCRRFFPEQSHSGTSKFFPKFSAAFALLGVFLFPFAYIQAFLIYFYLYIFFCVQGREIKIYCPDFIVLPGGFPYCIASTESVKSFKYKIFKTNGKRRWWERVAFVQLCTTVFVDPRNTGRPGKIKNVFRERNQ